MNGVVITKFGGPEVLEYQKLPVPQPGPNQVLIKTAAIGINFADIKSREGHYHGAGQPPFVPGLDVAGTIEAVGPGVEEFAVGQRVIAFPETGSYSEYTIAQTVLTYKLPDAVDFETAAACPTISITSYNLLHELTRIRPGETVLIHAAAGGIGTTAIQLAKIFGAGKIIGTVGSEEKADFAKRVGADYVINYRTEDFAKRALELTDGKGVDVILDSVAGDVFERGLSCLATFGRIAVFGHFSGQPGTVQTTALHASSRCVLGYSMGTNRRYRPAVLRDSAEAILRLLAEGKLQMYIDNKFPLKEAAAAQQVIEQRKNKGKILLLP
ncbi:quinone oxidoreductase family protein [Effusibacillus dendaii]|uniref:Quinone oxidoreductase n=1 Tax=Effusibacillus dendaii TaxID=2743772 RepID=A0A7I8DD60_9BACL|nr:quinone oxidoreductase [Effusibacillus dendaii]BCJ86756.1 quinone oxidoreductase [Effusibacillus dendaii]